MGDSWKEGQNIVIHESIAKGIDATVIFLKRDGRFNRWTDMNY